jgi:DnaK suppressor protein
MNIGIIKSTLLERLATLQHRLDRVSADASQPHSNDSSEQAQERENDEVIDQIGNETRASIVKINAALQRMTDDCYGICASCGEDINKQRLNVIPEATHCVNCAR